MTDFITDQIRLISDPSQVNRFQWLAFVESHPQGTVFQTPYMADLYNLTEGMTPLTLFCLDETSAITGLWVAVSMESGGAVGSYLTSRSVMYGGPLVRAGYEHITGRLINEMILLQSKKVIYLQVRNIFDSENLATLFLNAGFKFEEHLNYTFDLTAGQDTLWNNIHPTRRKQIRRSLKRGVTATIHNSLSEEMISQCYRILSGVYRRIKLPVPEEKFFIDSFRIFGDHGILKCVTAEFDNHIIGFRFFLIYRGLIYDWYAGSNSAFREKYVNDLLPWEVIRWGAENGCKTFDFGGAGSPGEKYGVRDYKQKFGGTIVQFGRYYYLRKPVLYKAGKMAMHLYKRLIVR